ncbi:MAG: vWA domain-containing protein [Burkholderiales bacterium]
MNMLFATPWYFALLPLALLPFMSSGANALSYSWLAHIPRDALSLALDWLRRFCAGAAMVLVIVGLSQPYRGEYAIERVGKGAEIVVLLDKSRSMDEPFNPEKGRNWSDSALRTKSGVAREMLAEFAAGRKEDLFGLMLFSSAPMRVMEFTQKPEVIQAAIRAVDIGKGLGDTDMGRALIAATGFFDNRPYAGSRIVMLVSDGGARLDQDTRNMIARLVKQQRIGLYWIYLRSYNSPDLQSASAASADNDLAVPEHALHKFFSTLGTPYRAYEAENPKALKNAIDDVGRLENLPLIYRDVQPRKNLADYFFAVALGLALLLAAARLLELRAWR